jgi:hypothetical protein
MDGKEYRISNRGTCLPAGRQGTEEGMKSKVKSKNSKTLRSLLLCGKEKFMVHGSWFMDERERLTFCSPPFIIHNS